MIGPFYEFEITLVEILFSFYTARQQLVQGDCFPDVDEGPLHGLQLTVNVQKYENLPFSEQDSGIKAS